MTIKQLSRNLDGIIEFGYLGAGKPGWKRPVMLPIQSSNQMIHDIGYDVAGIHYGPSNVSIKKARNLIGTTKSKAKEFRNKGMIAYPAKGSRFSRSEYVDTGGVWGSPQNVAKGIKQHELVHAIRDPRTYGKATRISGQTNYDTPFQRLKEEWVANKATLLGKRGKRLGTPIGLRLKHAITSTLRSALIP